MMAGGRGDMRSIIGLLLVVNFLLYLVIIGLASWSLNQALTTPNFSQFFFPTAVSSNSHLGGNTATIFVLIFALLGGVIGVLSVIAGFIHHRAWSRDSLGIATSTAFVSFAAMAIAFGLVCKEIALGGHRGDVLKALEAFVIISTFFQLLYLMLSHSGMYHSRYGPAYV